MALSEYLLHFASAELRDDVGELVEDLLADAAQAAVERAAADAHPTVELQINLDGQLTLQQGHKQVRFAAIKPRTVESRFD